MDLSKLPRLSNTPKPPEDPATAESSPPSEPHRASPVAATESGGEVWLSIAIGLIIILMSSRILGFVASKLFGTDFSVQITDERGQPLPYIRSVFFWGDLSMVLFGGVLVLEGVVLAWFRRRWVVAAALLVTTAVTALNLVYVAWMYQSYGLQLISALAVAFGTYIALHQWKLLQALGTRPR